jgi:hypothetical protein
VRSLFRHNIFVVSVRCLEELSSDLRYSSVDRIGEFEERVVVEESEATEHFRAKVVAA